MEVVKDVKNDLLKRREIVVEFEEDSNPGYAKSKEILSSELKVAPENVSVRAVRSQFGSGSFVVEAMVYDSADDLDKWEPKPKAKKGGSA